MPVHCLSALLDQQLCCRTNATRPPCARDTCLTLLTVPFRCIAVGASLYCHPSHRLNVTSLTIGLACSRGAEPPNPKKCSGRCLGKCRPEVGCSGKCPRECLARRARPPFSCAKAGGQALSRAPSQAPCCTLWGTFPSTPLPAGTSPSTSPSTFWGLGVRHLCSRQGQSQH